MHAVRSHERIDFKRCQKKWFWKWRKGLTPRVQDFGPLMFGTWVHDSFEEWYLKGTARVGRLANLFMARAGLDRQIAVANNAPEHVVDSADELIALGIAMLDAYSAHYDNDAAVNVIQPEIPLEFDIPDTDGNVIAKHMLKPDLVFADENDDVWLMEHKTAAQIGTEHLVIDDQARPYGSMAEPALRKLGIISRHQRFRGIMYNFLRKALPDERPVDASGRALNQNGTVSKRQPAKNFVRHPVVLSAAARVVTLRRIQGETVVISKIADALRDRSMDPNRLMKTPHKSCAKTCQFFTMCVAEENGTDISEMERLMFRRENPYTYGESTDVPVSFEMG